MPSELDTHDLLFNPVRKRRAQQAARRAAGQAEPSETPPVRTRADSDAPPTDRAVAYAIADADAGPLVSSKLIAGIAVVAAVATAAVLMRTPKLEASAQDETNANDQTWWTAAREQWANETMRVWPIVIRKGRSVTTTAVASKAPIVAEASAPAAPAPLTGTPAGQAAAPKPSPGGMATPGRTTEPTQSDNPYSDAPRAIPRAPAKATDNPYSETPASGARKPAAAGTDNPY